MENSATNQRNARISEIVRSQESAHRPPILALSVTSTTGMQGRKDFINGLMSDGGMDIRVDWNGDLASPGRFEVLVGLGQWQECPNIEISQMNDLVSPHEIPTRGTLALRIHRGPEHPTLPFEVRFVPISWLTEREPGAVVPPTYTAERGVDYHYLNNTTPDDYAWNPSNRHNGAHRVDATLTRGQAYEMHVQLQDPANPERWLALDPIIRTDYGGAN